MIHSEYVFLWLGSILVGGLIGMTKGQDWQALAWSILFGPFGVVIALCLPNKKRLDLKHKEIALREDEVRVQKAILAELQSAPRQSRSTPAATAQESGCGSEDFVPDNLRAHR